MRRLFKYLSVLCKRERHTAMQAAAFVHRSMLPWLPECTDETYVQKIAEMVAQRVATSYVPWLARGILAVAVVDGKTGVSTRVLGFAVDACTDFCLLRLQRRMLMAKKSAQKLMSTCGARVPIQPPC